MRLPSVLHLCLVRGVEALLPALRVKTMKSAMAVPVVVSEYAIALLQATVEQTNGFQSPDAAIKHIEADADEYHSDQRRNKEPKSKLMSEHSPENCRNNNRYYRAD